MTSVLRFVNHQCGHSPQPVVYIWKTTKVNLAKPATRREVKNAAFAERGEDGTNKLDLLWARLGTDAGTSRLRKRDSPNIWFHSVHPKDFAFATKPSAASCDAFHAKQ